MTIAVPACVLSPTAGSASGCAPSCTAKLEASAASCLVSLLRPLPRYFIPAKSGGKGRESAKHKNRIAVVDLFGYSILVSICILYTMCHCVLQKPIAILNILMCWKGLF